MVRVDIPARIDVGEFVLRSPRPEDVAAIVAECQDPELGRWTRIPSPYGPEDGQEFVALAERGRSEGDAAHYLIVDGESDALLGSVGLIRIDRSALVAEVGYWVAASARGRGVATRAVAALVEWGFEIGMRRIEARVLVGNDASGAVLSRVGFVEEGIQRSMPADGCGLDGGRVDLRLFSRIDTDRAEA